jgi:uncharacterized membrane protein YdjX (TVP38/TMEM64 family)
MGVLIPWLLRFGPLALIGIAAAVAISMGVLDHLTVSELAARHEALGAVAAGHPILSLAAFVAGFSVYICLSLPGLSLGAALAGLMFGAVEGGLAAIAGGTIGATIVLFAARRASGDLSKGWIGRVVRRIDKGIEEHGLLYLLAIRLVPVGPFWLVNLAAGCVRVPLQTYAIGTALGIAPSMFLYAVLGARLGRLLDSGGTVGPDFFAQPAVYIPIGILFVLALIPLAVIVVRSRTGKAPEPEL